MRSLRERSNPDYREIPESAREFNSRVGDVKAPPPPPPLSVPSNSRKRGRFQPGDSFFRIVDFIFIVDCGLHFYFYFVTRKTMLVFEHCSTR